MVEAMKFLPENYLFVIVGGGDVFEILKEIIEKENLENKVKIVGKVPYQELINYTYNADLGLSLDKNTNLNYQYSLPNKLFDYIQSKVPVLVSNLPEMKQVVEKYKVGKIVLDRNPLALANQISIMLKKDKNLYTKQLLKASSELIWKKESEKLIQIFKNIT